MFPCSPYISYNCIRSNNLLQPKPLVSILKAPPDLTCLSKSGSVRSLFEHVSVTIGAVEKLIAAFESMYPSILSESIECTKV